MSMRKYAAASVAAVSLVVAFAVFLLGAPMESVPLDGGWLGLLFIFANGFFLSYILNPQKTGSLERLLLTVGLGFGLTFTVMVLMGLFWEFSLFSVLLTQIILLAILSATAFLRGFRPKAPNLRLPTKNNFPTTKLGFLHAVCVAVIGVLVAVSIYEAISLPATEWDSLAYGVNYAKIMFQKGTIPFIAGPSIGIEMSASYPPGVQLVAVFLYVFAGNVNDFYYRLLPPIFGLATFAVTYKFAMLLSKNRTISLYAVIALSAVPVFWDLFVIESYLMALTLMFTLCGFFFYKAYVSNPPDTKKYEILGVLFCAFASLISYIGLFSFGVLLLYALHKKKNLKQLALSATLGIIVVLPWYLRNLVLLGNPLYPFFGVGKYLYPLLEKSTSLSFQQYNVLPEFWWLSTICKVGAAASIVALVYFTFSKRKDFFTVLPIYSVFAAAVIMGTHIAFLRYAIIAFPVLAVVLSYAIHLAPKKRRFSLYVSVALLGFLVLSSAFMLPYISSAKLEPKPNETESQYLARAFGEGDAWQWINQNTPRNATVATFDIKEYYLDRNVFALDGNESVPLYQMSTYQECLSFFQEKGVSYVLSVPWASPGDTRMPLAYKWCPFIRYLGDPKYFPPLFVGDGGATVYHVGPLDQEAVDQFFAQNNMVTPTKQVTFNLTITNSSIPALGKSYLPIPDDYKEGNMTASINCSDPLEIQLWYGQVPLSKLENRTGIYQLEAQWSTQRGNSSAPLGSSFTWHVDLAGYFTLIAIDKRTGLTQPLNATVNIVFRNYLGN